MTLTHEQTNRLAAAIDKLADTYAKSVALEGARFHLQEQAFSLAAAGLNSLLAQIARQGGDVHEAPEADTDEAERAMREHAQAMAEAATPTPPTA